MPPAKASGRSTTLVPAGELVRQMVAEAERDHRPPDVASTTMSHSPTRTSTASGTTTIVPALRDYIRIPNVSVAFDPQWDEHGHMRRAVELVSRVVRGAADRRA